jgi:hypothetical protein
MRRTLLILSTLILGLALWSAPALAQGKGNARQQDRAGVEAQRPGTWEIPESRDRGERQVRRGNGSGKVPPGWCQGVGNPHNTAANCGYGGVYDTRGDYPTSRSGSYQEAHDRFHRDLDYRYDRLAAQRPLDIAYRLELESRKRAEHNEWHRRMGISH